MVRNCIDREILRLLGLKTADEGIELLVSYGSHTNDFLLVECTWITSNITHVVQMII